MTMSKTNVEIDCKENDLEDMVSKLTHIIGDYYLGADERQYILYYLRTRKRREDSTEYKALDTIGYYSSLSYLLKSCAIHTNRMAISNGELTELRDCIKQLIDKTDEFTNMVNKFNIG